MYALGAKIALEGRLGDDSSKSATPNWDVASVCAARLGRTT
jgi:hypothetical protein